MINLDNRLLELLNGNELAVFIHIIKRVDVKKVAYPSIELLRKETGFGQARIYQAINSLIKKKILKRKQVNSKGKFTKTTYKILTDLAGVYVGVKGKEFSLDSEEKPYRNLPHTENTHTRKPCTEKSDTESSDSGNEYLSINHKLSINNSISIKRRLLSEIKISDVSNPMYLKIALKFNSLFKENLKERLGPDANTKLLDNAKGSWIDEIRLLIETDKATIEEIIDVFEFLKRDDFWQQNILSTKKLRKHFQTLLLQSRSSKKVTTPKNYIHDNDNDFR